MTNLLLDPYLLAIPEEHVSLEEAERWWESLRQWLIELEGTGLEWRYVYECLLKLDESCRSINFTRLRSFGRATGLRVDPNLISPLQPILQRGSKDLRAKTITNFIVSESEMRVTPAEIIERNRFEVRAQLVNALVCLGVDKELGSLYAGELRFVTPPLSTRFEKVEVDGAVDLIDPDDLARQFNDTNVASSFPLIFVPDDLVDMPAVEVVYLGEHEIIRHIARMARARYPGSRLLSLSLDAGFVPSLSASGVIHDAVAIQGVFERCSEIVADEIPAGARLEQVRETKAGASPALKSSDGCVAWRVSVTTGGPAWRLHFWREGTSREYPHGGVQFTSVLRHTDPPRMPNR